MCRKKFTRSRSWVIGTLALAILSQGNSVSAQTGTQRGATLGGLAGAIAGGLIGDHNDEAGAGAAIGGILGAVTGGIMGNAADKDRADQQYSRQYAQQQRYYQQQQRQNQRATRVLSAVSIGDVVSMSRNGLSDTVIINQIGQRGVQQQLQVAGIITMHQQGVHESVITAMQRARVGDAQPVAVAPQYVAPVVVRQPTVVYETHVLPSYPTRRYHYPHHPPSRPYYPSRHREPRHADYRFHIDF